MDDFIMSSLLSCHQEENNRTCYEQEEESYSFINIPLHDYGDEYISILIQRETELGFKNDGGDEESSSSVSLHWIKHARMDAINWILQTSATLGFHFQTAYLSVTYLDRFLSKCSIDSDKWWAIRLLSVACLTVAAKMEECKFPALSEFQLEDYCFENRVIQRMELLVLTTLEWNMAIITPFSFLPFFITKFCNHSTPTHVFSNTMQLIFLLMKGVNLMDHRPSVIAAAAILAALDQNLTIEAIELKISSIHQYTFLQSKDIFACYNQIKRLYIEKTRRDKFVLRPIGMIESSRVVSAAATNRRRRITFNDDKENPDEN